MIRHVCASSARHRVNYNVQRLQWVLWDVRSTSLSLSSICACGMPRFLEFDDVEAAGLATVGSAISRFRLKNAVRGGRLYVLPHAENSCVRFWLRLLISTRDYNKEAMSISLRLLVSTRRDYKKVLVNISLKPTVSKRRDYKKELMNISLRPLIFHEARLQKGDADADLQPWACQVGGGSHERYTVVGL